MKCCFVVVLVVYRVKVTASAAAVPGSEQSFTGTTLPAQRGRKQTSTPISAGMSALRLLFSTVSTTP